MLNPPDTLILTFAPGGSLSRWATLGRLEREKHLLRGLLRTTPHILFIADHGPREAQIAAALSKELDARIDAISIAHDDPELGPGRPLHDRVLARLGPARRVVIQTMQFEDAGVSRRLLGPLRRAGIQAALVARGGFVRSRVLAALKGPHALETVRCGADEHILCQHAQIVSGVSECTIEELCWRHGINPARTRVIPHFIHGIDAPTPAGDRDPDHLLCVGQLTHTRGVEHLLHAIGRLPERLRARARLEIVGDGPERERLADLARTLEVHALFAGRLPHDEVVKRMHACAIFLLASPERRQSRSVLEAMASGATVIVTDTPEYDGFVENASTGIRVKPSPEPFSFAIESLLGDPDWRGMLGTAAAHRIRTRCDLNAVLELSVRAYSDALDLAPGTVQPRIRRAG
jgi:glycosyltransferase involved in cell wall biosynthesis